MLNIEKLLKDNRMSVTKTRIKIIECLDHDGHHFHTIKDISNHTKGLNTKTVYNTIEALVKSGIIDSVSINGQTKYALNDGLVNDHDTIHIISDGKITHADVDDKTINAIKKAVEDKGEVVKAIRIFVDVK